MSMTCSSAATRLMISDTPCNAMRPNPTGSSSFTGQRTSPPAFDDASIARVLADTRRYEEICRTGAPMTVTAAYDGMEIDL